MFFPSLGAHIGDAEFQYPDRSWKETCGITCLYSPITRPYRAIRTGYWPWTQRGLALALADESSSKMTWNTAKSTCSGKTPTITGGTWKLATRAEWENMITAAGDFASLRDGFISVGGTNMQSSYYWSSTATGYDCAWVCNFSTGVWFDEHVDDYCTEYVRACLEFSCQP